MSTHHPSVYQALECFGAGLLVIAAFAALCAVLYFVGNKIERPVEAWFLRHPKVGKGVVIGGWSLMGSVVVFFIFEVGCYFGGH